MFQTRTINFNIFNQCPAHSHTIGKSGLFIRSRERSLICGALRFKCCSVIAILIGGSGPLIYFGWCAASLYMIFPISFFSIVKNSCAYLFISSRMWHTCSASQLCYICLSRTPARFITAPRVSVAKMRKNGFTKGTQRTMVLGYECPDLCRRPCSGHIYILQSSLWGNPLKIYLTYWTTHVYCLLIGFTKFFVWEIILRNVGFLIVETLRIV